MARQESSRTGSSTGGSATSRSRPLAFLLGTWVGATTVGCLAAWMWTHLITGKLFVPGKRGGGQLVEVPEVAEQLDRWIDRIEEA